MRQAARWGAPVATLAALSLGAVQLAARIGPVVTPAPNFEGEQLLLWFLSLLSWPTACALALTSAVWLARGHKSAAGPFLAGLAALSVPFLPLGPTMRDLDDALHRDARDEIVRRVEAGELRSVLPGPH